MGGVTTLRAWALGGVLVACSGIGAAAAPSAPDWASDSVGRPVLQTFLETPAETERREIAPIRSGVPGGVEAARALPEGSGDRLTSLSAVETPEAALCVLSRLIEIRDSRYLAPETEEPAPFEDILRSPAASFQIFSAETRLAETPLAEAAPPAVAALGFRIQFKYSLDRSAPATLSGPFGEIDLQPHVEPSTDSVRLGPEGSAAVAAALGRGERLTLSAVSRDTGRRVVDTLRLGDDAETAGLRLAALEDCAADLPALAEAEGTAPQGALRFAFDLAPTPATRVAEEDRARICAKEDMDGPVFQGRALNVAGAVLQSAAVYGHFDEAGALQALRVPGLLEARRVGDTFETYLSRAANANLPGAVNEVSGCIGSARVTLCLYPGEAGGLSLAPCLGEEAVFASGLGEDDAPAGAFAAPGDGAAFAIGPLGAASAGRTVIYPPGGRVLGPTAGAGLVGGGGGGIVGALIGGGRAAEDEEDEERDEDGDEGGSRLTPPGDAPMPIPAPPAGLLLAAAAGGSALLLRRRWRNVAR